MSVPTSPAPPDPFDRKALARNAERARSIAARGAHEGADFLLRLALDDIAERIGAVERRFERAVVVDPPVPSVAERLAEVDRIAAIEEARSVPDGRLPLERGGHDLVVSVMALHTVADVPGFLAQATRALMPDGLFIAVLPGGETLRELRAALLEAESAVTGGASPRVFPFIDVRDGGALLQRAGLALPVADLDRLTVRYADPLALMAEIRAMGMANALAARDRRFLSRAVLMEAARLYAETHADEDGRVRATFDLVSLSGWRPHESQQRPLAPGSARASLADALGDRSKD